MFGLLLPISGGVLTVVIIQIANKLGFEVHPFLLEPSFNVWIIMAGVIIAFCLWARQIFLMLAILIVSFIVMIGYYIIYILP